MPLVSENIALLVFGGVLGASAVLAWWMGSYAQYDSGSFHTFIAILAGLGVVVTFMFYYNVLQLQGQQQKLAAAQEFSRISDSMLDGVMDSMNDASVIIPNFVYSITPLTNTVCCDGTRCVEDPPPDPINVQTCTEKMTLSYRIFSLWQEFISTNKFFKGTPSSYIANFLQRANSKQLHSLWEVSKLDFVQDTQALGDLLFEYALPITQQTSQNYVDAANALTSDPRFSEIFC